jgi:hypothetical protein
MVILPNRDELKLEQLTSHNVKFHSRPCCDPTQEPQYPGGGDTQTSSPQVAMLELGILFLSFNSSLAWPSINQ